MAAIIPTRKDIREAISEGLKSFPDVEELKPEQVLIVENVVLKKDVFAALPTGFGKSLTFQILPSVCKALFCRGFDMPSLPVVIVVSPLSSIVKDQVTYLRSHGFEAAFIGESAKQDNDIFEGKIKCHFLYGSPESFVGDIKFREMFSQQHYRQNVVALVCDEVHTVVHWGEKKDGKEPFRKWCGLVGEIRSFLPKQVPFLALTATASPLTRDKIIKSLSLKKCLEISVSPNRENIKLFVLKVTSEISVNFTWLARELNEKNIACLRTLIYVRDYKTCGELYQFFMSSLLDKAYYPYGAEKKCTNRMVAMYHSGTSPSIQDHVLQSLKDPIGKVRIVIATNALGMGVDIKGLHHVINYGPPPDLESYVQEMGRAGRDGAYSEAALLFHGRQLRKCKPEMLEYTKSKSCRRRQILDFFKVTSQGRRIEKKHLCCDVCAQDCACGQDCPQNVGTMVSKMTLPAADDAPRGRSVSESDRRALKGLLEECQESMRQAVLQSSQHCFYSNIDQITGFTDRIIEDTTSKCDFLFSVDDIIEQIPVLSVQHAFKVYDCLCEVFTDLQQESLEQ